jgi:hypothetical protein
VITATNIARRCWQAAKSVCGSGAIFKAVNQFAILLLRNRLRIRRLYGVNGHRRQSHGGKAGILSDHLVKANDCQQKRQENLPL